MTSVLTPAGPTNGFNPSPAQYERPVTMDELVHQSILVQIPAGNMGCIPTNLIDSWACYCLQLSVPALDVRTVKIEIVARRVIVSGTYTVPVVEDGSYLRQQIPAGKFCETFKLPAEVDGDRARARYDRGILTIEMPKVAHLKPASIPVEVVQ
jgi:HSP20 family protein